MKAFSVERCLFLGRTLEQFNSSLIHWGRIAGWKYHYHDDDDDDDVDDNDDDDGDDDGLPG